MFMNRNSKILGIMSVTVTYFQNSFITKFQTYEPKLVFSEFSFCKNEKVLNYIKKEEMHTKIEFPLKWNFLCADYVNFVFLHYLKMFFVDQKSYKKFYYIGLLFFCYLYFLYPMALKLVVVYKYNSTLNPLQHKEIVSKWKKYFKHET